MKTLYRTQDICVALLVLPSEVNLLLSVFEKIATELSWQPGNQLRDCQEAAQHLAIIVEEEIAGGLQVVAGTGNSLPFQRVWPEVEIKEASAAHVTILALAKEYRGHPGLFWPLCVELWRWCDAQGIETILMEATPPTLRVYRRMGWPLEIVGELRQHWGEDCFLCRASVRQIERAIVEKAENSDAYRALVAQGYRDREVL